MYFWVTFKGREPGTVEAEGNWYPTSEERTAAHEARWEKVRADARERASKFGEVASLDVLPYPANPRLDVRSDCPSFCWRPRECKGRTACPRRRACDD